MPSSFCASRSISIRLVSAATPITRAVQITQIVAVMTIPGLPRAANAQAASGTAITRAGSMLRVIT